MKAPEEIIAERFAPVEDEGYFIAPEESPPTEQPAPAPTIQLTPKQLEAVKRIIWATSIGVSKRHPSKNKRKR